MPLIISLETSTNVCSVALSRGNNLLDERVDSSTEYNHAALLHGFIRDILQSNEVQPSSLRGVAVSGGPGSYTGLRIGTAAAKGLCMAWNLPLIAVSTLEVMMRMMLKKDNTGKIYLPMIDARRMEVYTQPFDSGGVALGKAEPVIADETLLQPYNEKKIIMGGNGSDKLTGLFGHLSNVIFLPAIHPRAAEMVLLAHNKLEAGQTVHLAHYEPSYLKEFQTQSVFHKKN